jgi:hypothetical protein
VARRKRLDPPPLDSPLPSELRRGNVTVETFVGWDEQPDSWCSDTLVVAEVAELETLAGSGSGVGPGAGTGRPAASGAGAVADPAATVRRSSG